MTQKVMNRFWWYFWRFWCSPWSGFC